MGKIISWSRNGSQLYLVGYSYTVGDELKRGLFKVPAKTDEEALSVAKRTLIPAKYPSFHAKVIGTKEWI